MKKRFAVHQWTISAAITVLLTGGCAYQPILAIRDHEAAARVKKVAILPFFDAQLQSAFDPLFGGSAASYIPAMMFDDIARKTLNKRYEIIGQKETLDALKKLGVQYVHVEGSWSTVHNPEAIRWGYTLADGMNAGKAVGADAVLLCAQGQYFEAKNRPIQAISLRLVDVQTGKTLYGLNATGTPGFFSKGVVVHALLDRIAKEAP